MARPGWSASARTRSRTPTSTDSRATEPRRSAPHRGSCSSSAPARTRRPVRVPSGRRRARGRRRRPLPIRGRRRRDEEPRGWIGSASSGAHARASVATGRSSSDAGSRDGAVRGPAVRAAAGRPIVTEVRDDGGGPRRPAEARARDDGGHVARRPARLPAPAIRGGGVRGGRRVGARPARGRPRGRRHPPRAGRRHLTRSWTPATDVRALARAPVAAAARAAGDRAHPQPEERGAGPGGREGRARAGDREHGARALRPGGALALEADRRRPRRTRGDAPVGSGAVPEPGGPRARAAATGWCRPRARPGSATGWTCTGSTGRAWTRAPSCAFARRGAARPSSARSAGWWRRRATRSCSTRGAGCGPRTATPSSSSWDPRSPTRRTRWTRT